MKNLFKEQPNSILKEIVEETVGENSIEFSPTSTPTFEKKIVIVTELYNERNQKRIHEYLASLGRNINNKLISEIHILYQGIINQPSQILKELRNFNTNKLRISFVEKRCTLQDLLDYSNKWLSCLAIACVADAFLDNSLAHIWKYNWEKDDIFGCLSMNTAMFAKRTCNLVPWCHGAYIFKSPIIKPIKGDYVWSTLGSDIRIMAEAYNAGYKIINPSLDIKLTEIHRSRVSHHTKWVGKPWRETTPHHISKFPADSRERLDAPS